jgi:Flp pilus assembly protein TadB
VGDITAQDYRRQDKTPNANYRGRGNYHGHVIGYGLFKSVKIISYSLLASCYSVLQRRWNMQTLLIIASVFFAVAFPVYLFLMRFLVSREERRKQAHFDGALKHSGRHL